MWKSILRAARSLASIVLGYAVIVALTSLPIAKLLGGVSFRHSSGGVLVLAGLAAVAGMAGGYAAALAAGRAPVLHAAGVVGLLITETTLLLTTRPSHDPLWHSLMGAGMLMGGCLLGGWLERRRLTRTLASHRSNRI